MSSKAEGTAATPVAVLAALPGPIHAFVRQG